MKRIIVILVFLHISCICLCQFSLDFTAGLGGMRRRIDMGIIDTQTGVSLGLGVNYTFDSIPLELNITPYYMGSRRYEEHYYSPNDYASNYNSGIIVMSGAGTFIQLGKIVQVFASLQVGYWYVKSYHYFTSFKYQNEWKEDDFTRKNSQLAIGPKLGIRLGKKRWKAVIQYENYFLSDQKIARFGNDRLTRLSIGVSFLFNKKTN